MKLSFTARVRRARELSTARNALSALAVLACMVLGQTRDAPWLPFVAFLVVFVPNAWRDRAREQRVGASRAGLSLDDERVARDAISNAFVLAYEGRLRVETRTMAYEIAMREKRRERTVRALDLASRAIEMRVLESRPFLRFDAIAAVLVVGAVIYVAASAFREHLMLAVFAIGALVGLLALASHRSRVTDVDVGIDGLSITRGRRTRFLPWSSVRGVRVEHASVLVDAGEGSVTLSTSVGRRGRTSGERATALAAWMTHARDAWANAPEPPAIDEVGAGAFRTTHVTDETLWEALRSARTTPQARVMAAAMLRARIADADRPKIRIAADECTAQVRARIRAVVDAEDDELEALAIAKL